jgi:threonine dehydrogenase-like Zn-dependent dehydrogenase
MIAAVLHAPRDLTIETRAPLAPGAGEAVIRVESAGLCGTDYRIWNGDRAVAYPRVMGHELVGRVLALGSGVSGLSLGGKVAIEPNYSCGTCPLCREGNKNLCLSRTTVGIDVDGGFAQEVALPAHCCWPAPAGIDDDQLILTEPLAVVVRAVRRGAPAPGETAAVLGVGALGLLAVQVLKARGCRVLAVGRSARRLPLAQALGADAVATTDAGDHVEAARALSGREGVDLVVETAGTAPAVGQAVELSRPGGRVVLTGLPHEASRSSFSGWCGGRSASSAR